MLGVALLSAAGCGRAPQQVWSTKSESSLASLGAQPGLDVGDQLPAPGTSTKNVAEWKQAALTLLMQASESTNPLLRANAVEALQAAPSHLPPVVRRCLGDPNRGVRFVAAMTVGRHKLTGEADLLEPLLLDESQSVQAAALYGLKRCGRSPDLTPLASMLMSDDPEVKGNAAFVLGEIGEPTAVRLLQHAAGAGLVRTEPIRRKIVDLQLAEAMAKLGEPTELEVIRAAMFAPEEQGELIALACQMCGELNDRAALPNLIDLATREGQRQQSAEVRMAAATAATRLDPSRPLLKVPAQFVGSTRFEQRAQAAHSIAVIAQHRAAPNDATLPLLSRLLNDVNPVVQVAAAGGVLRVQS